MITEEPAMNVTASQQLDAEKFAPSTVPVRSEAFAEDVFEFVERAQAANEPALRWAVSLTPLAVALVGVAFAVVPPLA